MILTFVKIVTNDHSSSIYSSPICDSIGRKGNSFFVTKLLTFPTSKQLLRHKQFESQENNFIFVILAYSGSCTCLCFQVSSSIKEVVISPKETMMHTILVINLVLTICLCHNYLLHNSILYTINSIIYLKQMHLSATSKEIGKLVSLCHCLLVTF